MSDDDATEVAAAPADVRFYAEASQDTSEHEVSSALTQGLRLRHGRHRDIRQITSLIWPKPSDRTISASSLALNSTGTETLVPMLARGST